MRTWMRRLTGWLVTPALVITAAAAALPGAAAEEASAGAGQASAAADADSYTAYLEAHPWPKAADSQTLSADDAETSAGAEHGADGVLADADGYIEWKVTVPENALYQLKLEYRAEGNDVEEIERQLLINGEIPFAQAGSVSFQRIWKNDPEEMDGDAFRTDASGNELAPSQIADPVFTSQYIRNIDSQRVEPYYIALKAGENTIRLTGVRGDMTVRSLTLDIAPDITGVTYADYLAAHSGADYTGETLTIQGEAASSKSAPWLLPQTDRTSPATVPSHPTLMRLNTIGGSNWLSAGSWIEWTVDVPQEGFYSLGIKFRQNLVSGMFTTRTLYINGEIPFEAAAGLEFAYDGGWQGRVLADSDGTAYKFYLKAGENTIRLEVAAGRAADLFSRAEASVAALNEAYRNIIMLTSTSPDPLRNYRIDKVLPGVMETFRTQSAELQAISSGLAEISGEKGSMNTSLDNLQLQLESFIEKPITIPSRLETYKTNVSSLASWVYELSSQPLEIDYITLSAPEKGTDVSEATDVDASFWEKLVFEAQAFIGSYTADYSMLSSTAEGNVSIDLWVNSGRDQATIIKRLADSRFTPQTGIRVNVKISNAVSTTATTTVSSLLMATVSGQGPDVAVSLGNSEPVNYGSRGAAVDLSQFPGFEEVAARFMESAMVPFEYQGGYYGLAETQTFPMMFYRTDILEELGLEPPETWEEMYTLVGDLQKRYMTVGIPGDMSYLATQILQNGGTLYNEDKSRSELGSQLALTQFKNWTNLYTSYELPLDYDAANRFRTGEMPIVISDYSFFSRISVLAPELKGLWDFQMIPGTVQEDGTIDHTAMGGGTCAMMLATSDKQDEAWEFLRWWTDEDTQTEYGRQLENQLGVAARHTSANVNAMKNLPWTTAERTKLFAQWEQVEGLPEVPGSYYVARNVDNALRNVLSYGNDPQEVLKEYAISINEETASKREEFGLE